MPNGVPSFLPKAARPFLALSQRSGVLTRLSIIMYKGLHNRKLET